MSQLTLAKTQKKFVSRSEIDERYLDSPYYLTGPCRGWRRFARFNWSSSAACFSGGSGAGRAVGSGCSVSRKPVTNASGNIIGSRRRMSSYR